MRLRDKSRDSDTPLLKVRGLTTYFFTDAGVVHAIDEISFDVMKGEILGLVGETGCGKSMTALSVMKLIPFPGKIVKGNIFYKGEDLSFKSKKEMSRIRGNDLAMIFQDPSSSLNPSHKIGDQVAEPIKIHTKISRKLAREKAVEIMGKVGLPDPEELRRRYPHELSGGMKQRIMIATAISCGPDLLIADEPTTALDVTIQAQILHLIKLLKEDLGSSIILITHDFGVVAEMCDRVAVMYAGKIVEVADVMTIFNKPLHPYTKGLLKALPTGNRSQGNLQTIEGIVPNLINPDPGCRFRPRCNKAMKKCIEDPPTINAGGGQSVACFLYEDSGVEK